MPISSFTKRFLRLSACGCGTVLLLLAGVIGILLFLLGRSVPQAYPSVRAPTTPPPRPGHLGQGLPGFDSPYIGHTGSWNGKGGTLFRASRLPELDREVAMGLKWTFMCVYWRALEPDGPVDLEQGIPPAWQGLDAFVVAAHSRGLNILMQAPVVGGNAGGPPEWAGRREPGKSAPTRMTEAAAFAGKLATRYAPGGTLARREGWGNTYGVRAWEVDNEPEAYRTHWNGQGADYAEFATRVAAEMKRVDPHALILAPGMGGGDITEWVVDALDASQLHGSPAFRARGVPYSIGPVTDVVTFHLYEGLDTFLSGEDRTVGRVVEELRTVFETWEQKVAGFTFAPKQEYWHTEGNYDFFGMLPEPRRAAWRMQFFTRAFAAGVRKVTVMDASPLEQVAVRTYLEALPDPFPMLPVTEEVECLQGEVVAFRHPEGATADAGQVWVLWANPGGAPARVNVPVRSTVVEVVSVDGTSVQESSANGRVRVLLPGDARMAAPRLVIDRPPGSSSRPDHPESLRAGSCRPGKRATAEGFVEGRAG